MTRKPRVDCKPLQLADADQQKVYAWIKSMGFEKARLHTISELEETFSIGSLHNAYGHWVQAESENRIYQAVTGADAIVANLGDALPKIDAAMEAVLKQAAFEAALSKDTESLDKFVNVLLRTQKAALDEKNLELKVRQYEDQIEAARKATENVARGGGLTEDALKELKQALKM